MQDIGGKIQYDANDDLNSHVGYLHKGDFICHDCAKGRIESDSANVYLVNIKPYSQTCAICRIKIVQGLTGWPNLFDTLEETISG